MFIYIYVYYICLPCNNLLCPLIFVSCDLTYICISTVKHTNTPILPPHPCHRNEVEIYKAKLRQEFGYSTLVGELDKNGMVYYTNS